ncbi:hypothetical protein C8R44DRAFT_753679 [Mycena epipterygia]|nr:hypothetical protein C8R44DRAFT_753679 [Mycena epipterygia]
MLSEERSTISRPPHRAIKERTSRPSPDTVVAQEPNRSQRLPEVPPEVIGLILSSLRPLGLSDVDAYEEALHRLRSLVMIRSASRLVSRTFRWETDQSAELWQPLFVGHATTPQRLAFFVKRLEFCSTIDLCHLDRPSLRLPSGPQRPAYSSRTIVPLPSGSTQSDSFAVRIMALLHATSKPVLKEVSVLLVCRPVWMVRTDGHSHRGHSHRFDPLNRAANW